MICVLFFLSGINLAMAMFPFDEIRLNTQYTDVRIKVSRGDDRITRSTGQANSLSVSFNISDTLLDFHLTRNDEIRTNVPIYTADDKGNIKAQRISELEEVTYYQDIRNGASFMMRPSHSSCMTGVFLHGRTEYIMEPKTDCTSVLDSKMEYRITQFNRTSRPNMDALKSGLHRGGPSHKSKNRVLRQRRQVSDYKIETLLVVDYAIYNYWYSQSKASTTVGKDEEAKASIRQFYAFIINGMDVRYKNIQTSAYKISILFSGIYIADTPSKSQFTENNKVTTVSGTQVDSHTALEAVTSWIQSTPGLPQHDHAMMFTRYDFTKDGSSDNAGLAWLSAVCTDQSVSVVEDHFDFIVLTVAAHELGHGLSAEHDGTVNSCSSSDNYIMAASSVPADNQNPWKFSTCSTTYFTTYIDRLNRENNNCMTVLSPDNNPDALKQYTALPGEIYDADAQCQHIVGPGSSLCKNPYNQNFTSICTKLWCKKTDGSNACVSAVGGDGMQCGNKKWCISGVCTYDECAPPGDESCLYGDREGVVITYNDPEGRHEISCSFNDIKKYPFLCHSIQSQCCRQCQNFFTGITGCEYGDKTTGCSTFHCPNNPNVCCGTCYSGPTITTPAQEPTTPTYQSPCRTKTASTATTTQSTTTGTSPLTSNQVLSTTAKLTPDPSYLFTFTITLLIDIPDDLSVSALRSAVISKLQAALSLLYSSKLGVQYISCVVRTVSKGSLIVGYDVQTTMTSQATADITSLSKDFISGRSTVTYDGQEVTVSSVSLTDTSGKFLSISQSTTNCEIQNAVSPCPADYTCEDSGSGPVCTENPTENFLEKYRNYIIYAGAGALVLILLFVTCICCLHKKRNRRRSSVKRSPPLHGVTNQAMDEFYNGKKRNPYHGARY